MNMFEIDNSEEEETAGEASERREIELMHAVSNAAKVLLHKIAEEMCCEVDEEILNCHIYALEQAAIAEVYKAMGKEREQQPQTKKIRITEYDLQYSISMDENEGYGCEVNTETLDRWSEVWKAYWQMQGEMKPYYENARDKNIAAWQAKHGLGRKEGE